MHMFENILKLVFGVLLLTSFASADFMERTLSTAGTATNLASGFPIQTGGSNTYLLLNSTSASDNQMLTIYYMTGAYTQRSATFTMNGTTQIDTNTSSSLADFAFVYGARLSSAAVGVVTINNASGVMILNITAGNTAPNFGAQRMCATPSGCTLRNLIFGGDGMIKTTHNITSVSGVVRTAFAGWSPAGTMSNAGSGLIRWGMGETLSIYATPYASSTNMSIYYEVG